MIDAKKFLQFIKKAALDAVQASHPADFFCGRVNSLSPLTVSAGKLELSGRLLVVPSHITGLQVNDAVVLGRKSGGQAYIILGVIN